MSRGSAYIPNKPQCPDCNRYDGARSTAASFLTRKKTLPCRILLVSTRVVVQHYSRILLRIHNL